MVGNLIDEFWSVVEVVWELGGGSGIDECDVLYNFGVEYDLEDCDIGDVRRGYW